MISPLIVYSPKYRPKTFVFFSLLWVKNAPVRLNFHLILPKKSPIIFSQRNILTVSSAFLKLFLHVRALVLLLLTLLKTDSLLFFMIFHDIFYDMFLLLSLRNWKPLRIFLKKKEVFFSILHRSMILAKHTRNYWARNFSW